MSSSADSPTSTGATPLVGRAPLLDDLRRAQRARRGVLLVGEPGVGKSRLADEVGNRLRAEGRTVVGVTATAATAGMPFGALAPLLPDGWDRQDDLTEQLSSVAAAVAELGPRLVLRVDDVHLLDPVSATVVLHLARDHRDGEATVVLTARTGEVLPEPIAVLWEGGHVERVTVPPLDAEATADLAASVADGRLDEPTAHRLHETSGGNPLFAIELVLGAVEAGERHEIDGLVALGMGARPTDRLADLVERRLAGFADEERRALELVALAPGEPIDLVVGLVGGGVIDRCERRRALVVDPATREVHLAHPVHGEVLRSQLGVAGTTRRATELVGALETQPVRPNAVLRLAELRRLAGLAPDADLSRRAAEVAFARHDHERAAALAEEAVAAGGGDPARRALGAALAALGRNEEAEQALAGIPLSSDLDLGELIVLAVIRADNLFWALGRTEDARAVLAEAEDVLPAGDLRRLVRAASEAYDLMGGEPAAVVTALAEALAHDGLHVPTAVVALAPAQVLVGATEVGVATARHGLAIAQREPAWPSNDPMLRAALVFALTEAGLLDAAERTAEEAIERARDGATVAARGWAALQRGRLALARGDLDAADRWLREAGARYATAGQLPARRWCVGGRAWVAGLRGDVATGRAMLAELAELPRRSLLMMEPEVDRARAAVDAAHGDLAAADAHLTEAMQRAEGMGATTLELAAAHDRARLGSARSVVDRVDVLAEHVQGPLGAVRVKHVRALVDRDATAIESAARRFLELGAVVLGAEALAQAGAAAQGLGGARTAARLQREARALAEPIGLATPAMALTAEPVPLTPREREVAALVAGGLTSAEAAARLVVSVRTVENHLNRIYAKLGVETRQQLAEVWAGGRPDPGPGER